MSSFGDQLREERERRDTTLTEVAERTRIDPSYLEALERNDFEALPGPRGFGKLYIRAYADLLGFDPRPLLDAFDAERARGLAPVTDGQPGRRKRRIRFRPSEPQPAEEPEAEAEIEPEPEPILVAEAEARTEPPAPSRWKLAVALAGLVVLALIGWGIRRNESVPLSVDNPPAPQEIEALPPKSEAVAEIEAAPEPEPVRASPESVPTGLHARDHGVGSGVENRRLVGRGDRFVEGSVVTYWTHVVGGTPGQRVKHVWLRDGGHVQTIELELGSASWRTHSNKTLWGRGAWAVELRDADGRVLARSEFECAAPGG